MNRTLLGLNLALAAILAALWGLDRALEARRQWERYRDSIFLLPAGERSPPVARVARIDLTIADSRRTWIYERREDGWRIPEHRGAFALGQAIDGILRSFLEGRGTLVGRVPADAAHFGVTPAETLKAELRDASGALLARAAAGRVAPGQRAGECFMTGGDSDSILHVDANPWAYLGATPASPHPPLIDLRVIPLALGRGGVKRLTAAGREPPAIRELIRRESPEAKPLPLRPGRPRYEWYGIAAPGGEKRLNDAAAFAYVSAVTALTFEEILGTAAADDRRFAAPSLTLTLQYDGGEEDTIAVGAPMGDRVHVLNRTTGQAFLVAAERARALRPDTEALLAPPGAPEAPRKER